MLVIITGASKGIGFELVKKISKDPALFVIAVSRNIRSLNSLIAADKAGNILPIAADITRQSDRKKIFSAVKKSKMKISVLVHNAGELVNKPFAKISEKELASVYSTNVFAPFQLTQLLLPLLDPGSKAHIVNISSMGGVQGSAKFSGLSAYSSSKAALCSLTECLAEEFKTKNIAVNCLALGAVQTEMLARAFPGYQAPLKAAEIADFMAYFALNGQKHFNGKIIPVSLTTP
jgi:3-oxoacyl-[acyl-carrier protein] reductase